VARATVKTAALFYLSNLPTNAEKAQIQALVYFPLGQVPVPALLISKV